MDKGIRPFARNLFAELNEQRRRNLITNTAFRKTIILKLVEEFGISIASAATHYNEAFKFVKGLNAEIVSGLGRPPEKNNGGRKRRVAEPVVAAAPLLLGWNGVLSEVAAAQVAQESADVKPQAPVPVAKTQAEMLEALGEALF